MSAFISMKCKRLLRKTTVYIPRKSIPRVHRKCRPVKDRKTLTVKSTIWQDIVQEDKEFENYVKKEKQKNYPIFECASSYLKRELFPVLIAAFEKLCAITLEKCVIFQEVRFFNFIDLLAEILYNSNPLHKERKSNWMSIHLVMEASNRPFYPYSWFLTPDEAAVMIQALVRGVQTREEYNIEEMKNERRYMLEGIEKQKKCYNVLKDDIVTIYADQSPDRESEEK